MNQPLTLLLGLLFAAFSQALALANPYGATQTAKRAVPSNSKCFFISEYDIFFLVVQFKIFGVSLVSLSLLPFLCLHLLQLTASASCPLLFPQQVKLTLALCLRTFALAFPSTKKTFSPRCNSSSNNNS